MTRRDERYLAHSAALTDWLEAVVPCLKCEPLEDFLRKRPAEDVLKHIEKYENTGEREPPTCPCGSTQVTQVFHTVAAPNAACRLSHKHWDHDCVNPSSDALQWVKSRLEERAMEHKMHCAWEDYVGRQDNWPWARLCAEFTPWALFPDHFSVRWSSSDCYFGPAPAPGTHDCLGAVVTLKRKSSSSATSLGGLGPWVSYLYRPSLPLNRDDKRGVPLTPAICEMVLQTKFNDADADHLFGSYPNYEVEVAAAGKWTETGWATPSGHDGEGPLILKQLRGATILFLGCCVLRNDKACAKLLQMKNTGGVILTDMNAWGFVGPLETHLQPSLQEVMKAAMATSTEWDYPSLCRRLALWFTAHLLSPKAEHLVGARKAAEKALQKLLALWKPNVGPRLFAPGTNEGWEDTAELTAMGAYYGSALATVVKLALQKVEGRRERLDRRKRNVDLSEELGHNAITLLTSFLKVGLQLKTNVTKEALLEHLARKAVAKNDVDLLELFELLQAVASSLDSITKAYSEQLDRARLLQAVTQAFENVLGRYDGLTLDLIRGFFKLETETGQLTSLRDGNAEPYHSGFGNEIFADLKSLQVHSHTQHDLQTKPRFKNCWATPQQAQVQRSTSVLVQQLAQVSHLAQASSPQGAPAAPVALASEAKSSLTVADSALETPSPAPTTVITPRRPLATAIPQDHAAPAPTSTGSHVHTWYSVSVYALFILMVALLPPDICPSHWKPHDPRVPFGFDKFAKTSCTAASPACVVTVAHEIADHLFVLEGDVVEPSSIAIEGWLKVQVKGTSYSGVSC